MTAAEAPSRVLGRSLDVLASDDPVDVSPVAALSVGPLSVLSAPDFGRSPAAPSSALALALPGAAVARRSFFAQPEPLKWIAGALMPLRRGPDPHSGQIVGRSAKTPCISSKWWPQAAQV